MDPITALSLAVTAYDVGKAIYSMCVAIGSTPEYLRDFFDDLEELEDVLRRIDDAMKLEAQTSLSPEVADGTYAKKLKSTGALLDGLLDRSRSRFQILAWILYPKKVEEYRTKIASSRDYFKSVIVTKIWINSIVQTNRDSYLRKWLGEYDYMQIHREYQSRHSEGTGLWFTDYLSNWIGGEAQTTKFLWLHAKSGSGKSCLVSYAIETIFAGWSTYPDRALLYFYCSEKEKTSQQPKTLLGSLIVQLCIKNPELWGKVRDAYLRVSASGTTSEQASLNELRYLFGTLAGTFQHVLVFLDAPNETPQAALFLQCLGSVAMRHTGRSMKVCVSSTPDLELGTEMSSPGLCQILRLDTQDNQQQDITKHIQSYLRTSTRLCLLSPELKSEVERRLAQNSENSFLYVDRHLQYLDTQYSEQKLRAAIHSIPNSVNEHYRGVLQRLPAEYHPIIKRLLRYLYVQTRLLTIRELEMLVSDYPGGINVYDSILAARLREVIQYCRGLVQYDRGSGTVSFVHDTSVREFLRSPQFRDEPSLKAIQPGTYNDIIRWCMDLSTAYLTRSEFRAGYVHSMSVRQLQVSFPLLNYWANSLPFYWQHAVDHGLLMESVTGRLSSLFNLVNAGVYGGLYGNFLQQIEPSYVPMTHPMGGAMTSNEVLLTPLGLAAGRGRKCMVYFLMAGLGVADLNRPSGATMLTPLLRASVYGHEQVARYLLQKGAVVTLPLNGAPDFQFISCSEDFKKYLANLYLWKQLSHRSNNSPWAGPSGYA